MSLSWRLRLSYAVGHILNDLCASVWFTYTLVFFEFGIGIPTSLAGTIILLGQVVDGLATPLIGYLSDRANHNQSQSRNNNNSSVDNNETNINCATSQINNRLISTNNRNNHINSVIEYNDSYSNSIYPHNEPDNTILQSAPSTQVRQPQIRKCWWPKGRKIWHFAGSILVVFSFPLLFGPPLGSSEIDTWAKMVYYAPLVTIFQIGWAAIQISHLALMNEITLDSNERTFLTSLRHFSTVLSNLAVYFSTFLLLKYKNNDDNNKLFGLSNIVTNKTERDFCLPMILTSYPRTYTTNNSSDTSDIIDFGANDVPAFQKLGLSIIAVGGFTTFLFQLGVRNSDILDSTESADEENSSPTTNRFDRGSVERLIKPKTTGHVINSWKDWLRIPLFWILGFFYMFVRLIVNVSQAYITVYLLRSLHLSKSSMALVPLTIYLTSIGTILLQKPIQKVISRELNSFIGLIFITSFSILVNYPGDPPILHRVYISAGILGIGCTTILITSLAMVSDIIGNNHKNGAFVYGFMSFADKLANGITIQIIELLWNKYSGQKYYQHVEAYGIGTFVIAQFIFLCLHGWIKTRSFKKIFLSNN